VHELQNAHVTRALLKICEDCERGRLEIVRDWIENSAPAYTNIEVVFEDVQDPILYFFDGDEELFKIVSYYRPFSPVDHSNTHRF